MIPSSWMAEVVEKTAALSTEAVRRRLLDKGWAVREGLPLDESMPDEPLSVWYHLESLTPIPEESTFQGVVLGGMWTIWIAAKDNSSDPHGHDFGPLREAVGKVLRSLFSTLDDVSLDSSVEFTEWPTVRFAIGQTSAGDGRIVEAVINIPSSHPMEPIIQKP